MQGPRLPPGKNKKLRPFVSNLTGTELFVFAGCWSGQKIRQPQMKWRCHQLPRLRWTTRPLEELASMTPQLFLVPLSEYLIDGGFSAEYANNLFAAINVKTIGILVVLCFVFGCIGAVIGKAVVKKHFEKAGIV